MKIMGIYRITSPAGRVYIGQSSDIERRWQSHRRSINDDHCKSRIKYSLQKHGFAKHLFEILHELPVDINKSVLDSYEEIYLAFHVSAGFDILNLGLPGVSGGNHSDETRQKISFRAKGRKVSERTKEKMSISRTGKKRSAEAIRKTALANTGRKNSPEAIKKISESKKGVRPSMEMRRRQSIRQTGVKHSDETKEKIRQSRIGRQFPRKKVDD